MGAFGLQGDDRGIADRVDEVRRLQLLIAMRGEHLPPVVIGQGNDPRPESEDRLQLAARGAIGHDHAAPEAKPPRIPRDALRHVSGAGCVHAGIQLLRPEHGDRVGGAADLEGTDGLQVLELEIELAGAAVTAGDVHCPRCQTTAPGGTAAVGSGHVRFRLHQSFACR